MNANLQLCKSCKNKSFRNDRGIICGLTNHKPDFEDNCKDYNPDKETLTHNYRLEYNRNKEEKIPLSTVLKAFFALASITFSVGGFVYTCESNRKNAVNSTLKHQNEKYNRDLAASVNKAAKHKLGMELVAQDIVMVLDENVSFNFPRNHYIFKELMKDENIILMGRNTYNCNFSIYKFPKNQSKDIYQTWYKFRYDSAHKVTKTQIDYKRKDANEFSYSLNNETAKTVGQAIFFTIKDFNYIFQFEGNERYSELISQNFDYFKALIKSND